MIYTVIAYKSDADDYCRGCHMESSSSQSFVSIFGGDTAMEEAANEVARLKYEDKYNPEKWQGDWEIVVLQNGLPLLNDDSLIDYDNTTEELSYDVEKAFEDRIAANLAARIDAREQALARADEEKRIKEEKSKAAAEKQAKENRRRMFEDLKREFEG